MASDSLKNVIAGSIGGLAHMSVGFPFDTVKVNMVRYEYSSPIKCFIDMIKHRGVRSLYRGCAVPLVFSSFYNSSVFFTFSTMKKDFSSNPTIAAIPTAVVASLIDGPADHLKTQMQTYKRSYLEIINGLRHRLLYQTTIPTLGRNIFSIPIWFTTFEYINEHIENKYLGAIIGGSTAGALSWSITYPLDYLKSSMQSDDFYNPKYKGYMDCIKKTPTKHMYRGIRPCIMRGMITSPILFLTYRTVLDLFDKCDL